MDGTITLPDGRRLAYVLHGGRDAPVVVHHHGANSSRLERPADTLVDRAGVRLLTVDRPGHGGSDPAPTRPVAAWGADLEALLDALRLREVYVTGWSQGCAFGLAALAHLGTRARRGVLVCPLPPPSLGGGFAGLPWASDAVVAMVQRLPFLLPLAYTMQARTFASQPDALTAALRRVAAGRDLKALDQADVQHLLQATSRAAYQQGPAGPLAEARAVVRDWGFAVEDVRQPVDLWSGGADVLATPERVARLDAALHASLARTLRDEGHALLFSHWERVLRTAAGTL